MQKITLLFAAISGTLAVAIGAFGAHGLNKLLVKNNRLDTFDTAVKYHFYHTIFLLFLGIYLNYTHDKSYLTFASWSIMFGIIVFSGSLYTLSITNIKILGAITPIGGLGFIIGWVCLILNVMKNKF